MEIILLGENSPDNETWLADVESELADDFAAVHIQYFENRTKGGRIDMNSEHEKLVATAQDCDQAYAICAKSAGVILTLDAMQANDIRPQRCVFVGAPIGASAADRFDNFRTPTLFIQHTHDPVRPAQKLKNVLKNHNVRQYAFKEISGNDDVYADTKKLAAYTKEFLNSLD